jgi:hypothetical protein
MKDLEGKAPEEIACKGVALSSCLISCLVSQVPPTQRSSLQIDISHH